MKASLTHLGGMRFRAKTDDGHAVTLDSEKEESPSPMQAALLAAMACTATDVVEILRKERSPFTSLEIEAEAERAKDPPRVFTEIRFHFRIRGDGIKESDVERAIRLSSERYCSVGIMLRRGGVAFVNTHEVLPSM